MKQSFSTSKNAYPQHSDPIKIALIVAISIVFLAVAYKATLSNTDARSRAAGDCYGTWKTAGKKKVCKMVKNKKGVAREVCSMEMQYYCAKSEKKLQEAGGNSVNQVPGGTSLQAVDGSGATRTPTPTKKPPTLQTAP